MGTDFEKLNIILAARDREFARAMERNTRRVERFTRQSNKNLSRTSAGFSALGLSAKRLAPALAAIAAAGVVSKLRGTVATLDEIGKTADKIGITTDALQELRTVAESAGIAQGSLDSSLERFNKRIGEAAMGTGAAKKMLDKMGIAASDLAKMGLDKSLAVIAERMAQITDPTEKAATAAALFGREGVAMVNLLREGAAGMAKMREDARALGLVIDEDLIRNAEGAQTQLDLMSRVISAQLNSALVSMAPLLVGGATVLADVARAAASAASYVKDFANPQSDLQKVTENLVMAMGDEIRQSQLLEATLSRGVNVSVGAARAKLEEARSRHENVSAIIAERKAAALGSDEWGDLTGQIQRSKEALDGLGFAANDIAVASRADAFESEQLRLAGLITQRQNLLKTNAEMDAQLARSAANIDTLSAGISSAKGGVVDISATYINPIENSPKAEIAGTGSAAAAAIPELSDYAAVLDRVNSVFGASKITGGNYAEVLARVNQMHESGELTGKEYAAAIDAIGKKFEDTVSSAQALEQAAEQTMAAIFSRSQTAGDAVADLAQKLSGMAASAAFSGMFGGMFDGVSAIFSGEKSFDGGGYTGNGPRSGGLDGKGGFMAMMHPQESVIDHTKGQSAPGGGGGGMNVNVTVVGARGNSEITEMVQAGVEQGLSDYDRTMLPRRVAAINNDPRRIS